MEELIDIAEVVRTTGLTSRALRFYEGRGLIRPLRTNHGRRLYGRADLARLAAIQALKRAGFSLADIGGLLAHRATDLGRLVAAQLEELERRSAELKETQALLRQVKSRIDAGEQVDVATLCSLIRKGQTMEEKQWKAVADRYFSPEEQQRWHESKMGLAADFDQAGYHAKWKDLGSRIAASLPLDPASEQAKAFVREWFTLLAPFTAVATSEMWEGSVRLYEKMPEWQGEADPGFNHHVWQFIRDAAAIMRAAGEDFGPLPAYLKR